MDVAIISSQSNNQCIYARFPCKHDFHVCFYIDGIIHCSGGAQTKVLNFVDNLHIVKDDLFEIPPLFKMIQKESGTPWRDMYKVFNMGHRMEIYINPSAAKKTISIANEFGIDAKIIGRVEANNGKKLTIKSQYGEFIY